MADAARISDHFSPELWQALWLTLKLAGVTTFLLCFIGLAVAQWLNTTRFRAAIIIETVVSLPIVLPPTVIGFYLLVLMAPQHAPGSWWLQLTGHSLTFSFIGLVIGSVIYCLPFAVQPFQAALKAVPESCIEAAATAGANPWRAFWRIRVPLARRGLAVGATLVFAHTIGEFGVVLMLGGNIPGETKVASIALYDEVQKLNYSQAHAFALVLLVLSFALLLTMALLQRSTRH
ncbi:MAG TPA: molybdate ABC transporter permease subunit [Opitutaceae bacterium]|nr:molybdate ABC transporter permease subunit [Opitutaceae bacterium]